MDSDEEEPEEEAILQVRDLLLEYQAGSRLPVSLIKGINPLVAPPLSEKSLQD